jgi:hypothetical protein
MVKKVKKERKGNKKIKQKGGGGKIVIFLVVPDLCN